MTIDQLVARLNQIKDNGGGDKQLYIDGKLYIEIDLLTHIVIETRMAHLASSLFESVIIIKEIRTLE